MVRDEKRSRRNPPDICCLLTLMTQEISPIPDPDAAVAGDSQSPAALAIARGVARVLRCHELVSLTQVTLPDRRRADVVALSRTGAIWIVEIKSSIEDVCGDRKWPEYRAFCDQLYFAVALDFPIE